jgi:hypothetical protein
LPVLGRGQTEHVDMEIAMLRFGVSHKNRKFYPQNTIINRMFIQVLLRHPNTLMIGEYHERHAVFLGQSVLLVRLEWWLVHQMNHPEGTAASGFANNRLGLAGLTATVGLGLKLDGKAGVVGVEHPEEP